MEVVRRWVIQPARLWCRTCSPNPFKEHMEYAICIGFKDTNNKAEYEALLTSLKVVAELEVESLDIYRDSQLVVNQVQGDFLTEDLRMVAYLDEVKAI